MFEQVLKGVMVDLFMLVGCAAALAVLVCALRVLIGLLLRRKSKEDTTNDAESDPRKGGCHGEWRQGAGLWIPGTQF